MAEATCGWTVGPIWKDGGDTCVCDLPPDHHGTPWKTLEPHHCSCGSWFARCGRAADAPHPMLTGARA